MFQAKLQVLARPAFVLSVEVRVLRNYRRLLLALQKAAGRTLGSCEYQTRQKLAESVVLRMLSASRLRWRPSGSDLVAQRASTVYF